MLYARLPADANWRCLIFYKTKGLFFPQLILLLNTPNTESYSFPFWINTYT